MTPIKRILVGHVTIEGHLSPREMASLADYIDDARNTYNAHTCHTYPDTMFGVLRQMLHEIDPALHWESGGTAEKDHKVWVVWKGQTKAIGFVHELVALSQDKLAQLLALYFDS